MTVTVITRLGSRQHARRARAPDQRDAPGRAVRVRRFPEGERPARHLAAPSLPPSPSLSPTPTPTPTHGDDVITAVVKAKIQ